MSLINDMLSDLHARDALPMSREALSGLRPVHQHRTHRRWLLLAVALLFATSAWAFIQLDYVRGADPVSDRAKTIDTPVVAALSPVVKVPPATESVTENSVKSAPWLMLDTHLQSIKRPGAERPPLHKVATINNRAGAVAVTAKPAPARHVPAGHVPVQRTVVAAKPAPEPAVTAPPAMHASRVAKDTTNADTSAPGLAKAGSMRPKIRASNPLDMARTALADGRPHDAEPHFRQLTSENPGDTQAWLFLARARSDQGNDADAEFTLMTALPVVDNPAAVARALARRLVTRNSVSEALKLLEAYRPDERLEPDHDAFIAALHQRLGRHDIAVERYRGILAIRPEAAAWWVGLAISEEARGHSATALAAYHHAHNLGNLDPRLAEYATRRITSMQGAGSS